ncbi:Transcriptional regulatory protein moc3 [Zalerion maritima]|uniref:Transcriptional regulatory protein moc3 n=1 Tax=Zalerion maritima TaxID=339359 RepID=A0AAD5RMR6_9PEZI|nr:Transcriptional regulatory protein moc3 [Zalerion maritima]
MPVLSEDGDLPWSDTHSSPSDDACGAIMIKNHSPWMGHPQQSATSHMHTGQLSPISTGMEIPSLDLAGSASASDASAAFGTSASSVSTWGNLDQDIHWEPSTDDSLHTLKVEPTDDNEFHMEDVNPIPDPIPAKSESNPVADQVQGAKVKRPRGRPRKHPHPPIINTNKVTKGRSKTGCITCRKRKKKCDEAKPRCMNCEKNAVVCEGYHEKQIWKSGKERAEEERLRRESLPSITMQPLFHGIETAEDRIFWKHYCDHLSTVLTVEGEAKNAFKDIMVPLATKHQGVMHGILALSGKHIDFETPYGAKILKDYESSTTREILNARADYHHQQALGAVYADNGPSAGNGGSERDEEEESKTNLHGSYGLMLCFLLQTMAEGDVAGAHRIHLACYQRLMSSCPPRDPTFITFISEFFQYHIYADELLRPARLHSLSAGADWKPPTQLQPPRLIGVVDGLFAHLGQISRIRQTIRNNIAAHFDPVVDYMCLYQAAEIDAAVQEWSPQWPPGDGRDKVTLLYKQMLWIYLFQTIHPPAGSGRASRVLTPLPTTQSRRSNMGPGSSNMSHPLMSSSTHSSPNLPATFSTMTVHSTQLPPPMSPVHSNASSTYQSPNLRPLSSSSSLSQASAPAVIGNPTPAQTPNSQPPSASVTANSTPMLPPLTHTNSMPLLNRAQSKSPPPIRVPEVDSRLVHALNSSLDILDSFKPSDPCQTLLLIPCLLLGVVSFSPNQRERARQAVRAVRGYTGLRNCDRVRELLERVWERMNAGDLLTVWDWQSLAGENGDFLCA